MFVWKLKSIDKLNKIDDFPVCGWLFVELNGYSCITYQRRLDRPTTSTTTTTTRTRALSTPIIPRQLKIWYHEGQRYTKCECEKTRQGE